MKNVKNIFFSLLMPLCVFAVFFIISRRNGVSYGVTTIFWELFLEKVFAAVCTAYALAVQIKNGRFDFSGGALMTVAAITAGYLCKTYQLGPVEMMLICIALCLIGSLLVAIVYIYGRLPVIICTIGMALVFEAITNVVNDGAGIGLSTIPKLTAIGSMPLIFLPLILAAILYFVYSTYTVSGKKAALLTNNQEAAVNIGIAEGKNVIQSFVVSGILYGFASVILVAQASPSLPAVTITLGSVVTAFASILPVFMGFFLGSFSNDTFGIILSTLSVMFMTYAIELNVAADVRSAYSNICMGIFMIAFFIISEQGKIFIDTLKKSAKRNI